MKRLIFSTALSALALAMPVAAQAQQLPPGIIAVVDRNRVASTCTPCVAATQQIQAQGQQYQQREAALLGPLQTEGQAIRTALAALPRGSQPDAAMQARIRTFETQREAASAELTQRQETLRRNENYLVNQILERMTPLIQQVSQQRGASITMDTAVTLFHAPQLNITDGVLALMNQNSNPFITVAPAQQQQQQQQQQPPANRPPGR